MPDKHTVPLSAAEKRVLSITHRCERRQGVGYVCVHFLEDHGGSPCSAAFQGVVTVLFEAQVTV